MKIEKLDNLQIEWKRGSGLRKSDLDENGKNKCILYGELYTKHKSVLIESSEISRTNKEGKVHSKKGDILVPGTSTAAKKDMLLAREIDEDRVILGGDINIIRPEQGIFAKKYLPYFFETFTAYDQLDRYITGATGIIHISNTGLKNLKVPLPPLPEQQRIVSILDQAFAAIDKAKANAELNLQNAAALFESYLQGVFDPSTRSGQGNGDVWEEKKLGEVTNIQRGSSPRPKGDPRYFSNTETEFNWITISDISSYCENNVLLQTKEWLTEAGSKHSRFVDENEFIIAVSGSTTGKCCITGIKGFIYDGLAVAKVKKNILDPIFLLNYMLSLYSTINNSKAGAAFPNINTNYLNNLSISFPPLKDQQTIVRQLDALRAETQKLEAVYQKKMDDLEELKKSILQKAFAGELTSSASARVLDTKVIQLQKVEGISPTDLQAGVTALALQKHIEQNQQHSFHHVKAEKIVHLSEYILNIDLNRKPIKDAAGPNDFPHAKKVESRARKAGFYSVYKNGDYYDYKQGNSFSKVIEKAQISLREKADTLSQLIDILAPMSTQQAEIVATVYAAWNNLLLSGIEFTDENIVMEARENWHRNKMAIERNKFFSALAWMKKIELFIPKGNGKMVEAKMKK